MFKKFKDKLAEEMKQSPSRLQAGMQQLAQAVISPAASNNLIQDITTSNECLNLTSEEAEALHNTSATSQFQSIDLQSVDVMERSRRSSFSSVTSENLFPSYERPGSLYHLQSDVEQSASEYEDSSTSQLEHITKDELYIAYQKLRTKYTKYRAVYRDLYKENMKMKSVLVETQDKALKRISNLKEQCQLEQEAKAHLEEALRNDIEEKDHLINTLNTKIKLLQVNGTSNTSSPSLESEGQSEKSNVVDLLTDSTNASLSLDNNLITENTALKEKIRKFETLLAKCNESLKRNKEKISQLTENRDILERDLNVLKTNNAGRTNLLENEIYKAKCEILSLNEQIEVFKKREEDSALSLAENKLFIHRELEVKEEQNKQLQEDLKKITGYKDILAEAVVRYDHEFKQFESMISNHNIDVDKKLSQLQNLFTNRSKAMKLIQQDVKHKFIGTEEETWSKNEREVEQKKKNLTQVQEAAIESVTKNDEISKSSDELEIQNAQLLGLMTELKSCKSTINDLKKMLKEVTMDWEQVKREKECLIANILDYKKIISKLKRDCHFVKTEVKENYSEQEVVIDSIKKEMVKIFNTASSDITHGEAKSLQESQESALSIEFKTITNENNTLRIKCEQLMQQNEGMLSKVNECEKINSKNIKLIAEIDKLNFKLRDITELQENQDKLQLEVDGLKGKLPSSNNIKDDEHLINEVSCLKEKLSNYDVLIQENTALKQELINLKNKSAATLKNMELLKSEQVENAKLSVENFSRKCADYENMIVNLTGKFTEQTQQLEKLHEELTVQKNNFHILSDKYEIRNKEFKEMNDAFAKQSMEMKELSEKYKLQCSEIEELRQKEAEIIKQLDETVKLRQEMVIKVSELQACKNNIIEAEKREFEELNLKYEKMVTELETSEKMKKQVIDLKTNETECLNRDKAELIEVINRLKIENSKIDILKSCNTAQQFELEELKANNVEVIKNNIELKEEKNNLLKLNEKLIQSQNNLQQQNEELRNNISKLEKDLECLQKKLDSETCAIEKRNSELFKELKGARAEVSVVQAQNTELQDTLASLQVRENNNNMLAAQVVELKSRLEGLETLREVNIELEKNIENMNSKVEMLNNVEATNMGLLKEIEELNGKMNKLADLELKNQDLEYQIETLKNDVSELESSRSTNLQLCNELEILNKFKAEYLKKVENLQRENAELILQIEDLKVFLNQKGEDLNLLENKNKELLDELETVKCSQSETRDEKLMAIMESENTAKDFENKFIEYRQEVEALKIVNKELQGQLIKMNSDYSKDLENKTGKIAELEKMIQNFENKFIEHQQEVGALTTTNKDLDSQLAKLKSDYSKALDNKSKTITELEKATKDFENKLIGCREEVEVLESENKNLREQLTTFSQNRNVNDELKKCYDGLQNENKELQTRLDETVLLHETKESQTGILNQELKHQIQELSERLKTNDEEQSMRIKQLVKEFQAQIHDKDEQIQAALEKRFEHQQNYETELIQQYKEQLKDFQIELTAKSEQIENLILDNKETVQAYKDQIAELTQTIAQVKKEHMTELQDIEQHWKAFLKQKTDHLEDKHLDEINELTKEWWNERKDAKNSDTSPRELESTSRVAMATIQSNTGSLHSLQQTLISQKRELAELRKLLRIRNDNLEGSTEIEYLRNILFEYMMGRETLVLSRVISAVVKFDQEQTSKVLKKEEDKLTLLGSLGLL